ncbi:hypothetical protein MUN35_17895, partial [Hafnia paralvei]|uniref:hypothetical protein n=1 Tax=Hafnia paralvei TaxID=546367 RepID=UPI001FFFAABA
PRATGLSSVAFASGFMETHLLTGERNISLQSHRRLAFQTGAEMASRIKSARVESPRATGLSSVAFGSGVMETHVLTGERNISPQSHRIKP